MIIQRNPSTVTMTSFGVAVVIGTSTRWLVPATTFSTYNHFNLNKTQRPSVKIMVLHPFKINQNVKFLSLKDHQVIQTRELRYYTKN